MVPLICFVLLACSPSLDGSWEGPLDCGPGTVPVDMGMDLSPGRGGEFDGEGFIAFTQADGTDREITFDVTAAVSGGAPLVTREYGVTFALDSCRYDGRKDDCYAITNAAFDPGDDVLTGDIDGFLQSWDCDFELER
ncbi:MAG: hypothetical protein D6798_12340 [Deltaproteobacteria bacterium]|nr:MAG: hypothetical protein D6798_12340 [Deltaproteobacteria bacterium]